MASGLAALCDGSIARAQELADPELWVFRTGLLQRMSKPAWDVAATEKAVLDFVQAAGTEASKRRQRLRSVIGVVLADLRGRLRHQSAAAKPGESLPAADPLGGFLLAGLDACLAAVEQVDRNANQSLVVGHWLARLAGYAEPLPRVSA
jgi:hypothetical protein